MSCVVCESDGVQLRPAVSVLVVLYDVRLAVGMLVVLYGVRLAVGVLVVRYSAIAYDSHVTHDMLPQQQINITK